LLLQEAFRARAAGFATGTTVLALPRDAVLTLQCAAPSATLISAFDSIVQPLIERQWTNDDESRTLATIRDALLPKLVSGEVRIKDAERIVGEST
jgi:type I restriction enzyme S subunit